MPNAQLNRRVVITGGSGKAGRAAVAEFLAHHYAVTVVDQAVPKEPRCPSIAADLTDYGQTLDALSTGDDPATPPHAVVHLAAIPAPRMRPNADLFRNNTLTDYNVFEACRRLGVKHVVYASSETVLGLPFDVPPPYVPVDEDYPPRPNSAYSLAKVLAETMAAQFCRWDSSLKMAGLRLSNVMEPHDHARFPSFDADPVQRKWNLWGYIDARDADAAAAMRLAVEAPFTGAEVFVIANADMVMWRVSCRWCPSRSSKPLSARKGRGRFDSNPLLSPRHPPQHRNTANNRWRPSDPHSKSKWPFNR